MKKLVALFVCLIFTTSIFGAVVMKVGAGTGKTKVDTTVSGKTKVAATVSAAVPTYQSFAVSAGSSSASSQTISLVISTGDTVWVGAKWEDAARTVTVTDSASNSYTAMTQANFGAQIYGQMFRCVNATGGSLTITVTYGAATAFVRAGAVRMTNVTAFDAEAVPGTGNVGSGGSPAITSNITTVNNVEVLICMVCNYNGEACAPQTSWTEIYDPNAFEIQYFTTTSASTYHGEGTLAASSPYAVFMCAFK